MSTSYPASLKARHARVLRVLAAALASTGVLFIVPLAFVIPGELVRYLVIGGGLTVVGAITFGLAHFGFVRLAALSQIVFINGIATYSMALSDGVSSPAFMSYLIGIFIAGYFFGYRGGLLMALAAFTAGGVLAYLASLDLIPHRPPINPYFAWMNRAPFLVIVVALQWAFSYTSSETEHEKDEERRQRHSAELERNQLRQRLDQIIRDAEIGTWQMNIQTGEAVWSEKVEQMFGFAKGTFDGRFETFLKTIHPDDVHLVQNSIKAMLDKKRSAETIQYRILRPDGLMSWISGSAAFYPGADGEGDIIAGVVMDVTIRQTSIEALPKSEERYRAVVNSLNEGIVIYDSSGSIVAANDAAERILGLSRDQIIGRSPLDPGWQALRENREPFPAEEQPGAVTVRSGMPLRDVIMGVRKGDGTVIWLSVNSQPLYRRPGATVVSFTDISDARSSAAHARKQENRFREIFEKAPGFIMLLDNVGRIRLINRVPAGHNRDHFIGQTILDFMPLESQAVARDALNRVISTGEIVSFDHVAVGEPGRLEWYSSHMFPLNEEDGEKGLVLMSYNISERKRMEAELDYLAFHDSLTGLANRDHFVREISRLNPAKDKGYLFFIDLDNFKTINDSLGHSMGDSFLVAFSGRLHGLAPDPGLVVRLGGDEFLIYVRDMSSITQAERFVQQLVDGFQRPFALRDIELYVTLSIGISRYPDHGASAGDLLKSADAAMYKAKEKGRNTWMFFSSNMTKEIEDRLQIDIMLRRALSVRQMEVYYQPQVEMRTGKLVGVEALIRWAHPERGFIAPALFIPYAEHTGMILQLGSWVMEKVISQLWAWEEAGLNLPSASINVSARQLNRDLVHLLSSLLAKYPVDPNRIELELTETAIMVDHDATRPLLEELRALGIRLAIDDFGTGYSSLSYLQQLPISCLKIDRSFIRDISHDQSRAELVCTILAISKQMNLEVIAEGIEEKPQADFLIQAGCRLGQGFLYAKPMTALDLEAMWLRRSPQP